MSINQLKLKLVPGTEIVIYNYLLKTLGKRKVIKQTQKEMVCEILDDNENKGKESYLPWKGLVADIDPNGDIILTDKETGIKQFQIGIIK